MKDMNFSEMLQELKGQEKFNRIQQSNAELEKIENQKEARKVQEEIENACNTAKNTMLNIHSALNKLCTEYRNKLYECPQLDYDANKKIIREMIKQYLDDDFNPQKLDELINYAYGEYEFKMERGLI